jgi:2-polyprenyl-3-methyl-5-hydroxy-6-metoxy-1,4-benzoquinol methylase
LRRGAKCTGISISQSSIDYLHGRAKELGYDWELIHADLLAYQTDRKYDAIVIMGVTEHLPQYNRVLAKFVSLLKLGDMFFSMVVPAPGSTGGLSGISCAGGIVSWKGATDAPPQTACDC